MTVKLKIRQESKTYGFLRCSEETVPRLKAKAALLGFPSMVEFLDELSKIKVSQIKDILGVRKE